MILNKIVYGKCIYSRIEATVMLFMRSSDQLKFCAVFCKEIIAKIYRIYSRIEATVMLFMRSGQVVISSIFVIRFSKELVKLEI
jgi:hypothetical protein